MITVYRKSLKHESIQVLESPRSGVWIDAQAPTANELEGLEKLGLDLSLLQDALDPYEVPRLEIEDGVTYLFTRVPHELEGNTITAPLLIAVGDDFLCTVSAHQLPILESFTEGRVDFATTQKTKLLLQLFTQIHASYQRFLTRISRNVRSSSVKLERISNQDIVRFVQYEMVLNDYLSALVPSRSALESLLSSKALTLYEEDKDLVEDLLLASGQLIELARSVQRNIVYIRDAYSTIMTNNLNRVIKLFTALTILLTVPMVIASFYGMNVELPYAHEPWIFGCILVGTLGVSAVLLGIFARNRWL